ncbi:MAG TPA: hypothetical protein VMS84_07830 [Mycobacterium sp.]|jgi:hypothetical protein|nr:hypothetical protein [Mycobacterium sp.]
MAEDEKLVMVDKERIAQLRRNLRETGELARASEPWGPPANERPRAMWVLLGGVFAVLDELLTEVIGDG